MAKDKFYAFRKLASAELIFMNQRDYDFIKLIPPGLEPGTFRVLGERDNHYTTESTALQPQISGLKAHFNISIFLSGSLKKKLFSLKRYK